MAKTISDKVVILAADNNYLQHAKSLLVNIKKEGQWDGDIALIVPPGTNCQDISNGGVHIIGTQSSHPFFQKFTIFSGEFRIRHWQKALFLDCDVLVQRSLAPIFDMLEPEADERIFAIREPFNLEHCFTYWRPVINSQREKDGLPPLDECPELFNWLWSNYDKEYLQFNTGMMLFSPWGIPHDAVEQMVKMKNKIDPINTHVIKQTDQPIINLVFYGKFQEIGPIVRYWGCEEPESRVLHYTSGYGPWIEKLPGMDAYENKVLGEPCNDIYKRNLSLFNQTFPRLGTGKALDMLDRGTMAASIPHGGVVAEIGTQRGDYADIILSKNKPKKLYLVDCWEQQSVETYGHDPANVCQEEQAECERATRRRFRNRPEVEIIKGYSLDVVSNFPNDFFDWIYLDGNHLQLQQDLGAWIPKVKRGGWIAGHDYRPPPGYRGDFINVKSVVDKYVEDNGYELLIVENEDFASWAFKK